MTQLGNGPEGILITHVVEIDECQTTVDLVWLLPSGGGMSVVVRFLGKGGTEITTFDGRPHLRITCPICPVRLGHLHHRGVDSESVHTRIGESLQMSESRMRLPQHVLAKSRHLSLCVGNGGGTMVDADSFVLVTAKKHLGLSTKGARSLFLLWTRERLDCCVTELHAQVPALQRDTESAADALYDIYQRMISGKYDFGLFQPKGATDGRPA